MTDEQTLRNLNLISRLESQIEDDGIIIPQVGSTNRIAVKPPLSQIPKGPNGRRLCRWCNTEIPKGRIAYCSDACQVEVNVRCNPGSFRFHVGQRDKGICAQCGFDTGKLERIICHAKISQSWLRQTADANGAPNGWDWRASAIRPLIVPYNWKDKLLRLMGLNPNESLWSADHIIEVADGGGETGLENAQTLCQICHKAKTAENRRRRAEERKAGVQPKLDLS